MRVVIDASALAAVVFHEAGAESVHARVAGATICAPELLKYELTNVAVNKARRHPAHASEIFSRLDATLNRRRGVIWHDVNPVDVAVLATITGLSAYDASYLWLAGWLEADLVTLDKRLAAVVTDA